MADDRSEYLLAEYAALRSEIDGRREMRYKLVSYALILFGSVTALSTENGMVAPHALLVVPVICCLLSLIHAHNTRLALIASTYIRERIEPAFLSEGWEAWIVRAKPSGRFVFSNNPTTAAVFVTLDVFAIGLFFVLRDGAVLSIADRALLLAAVLGLLGTVLIHWQQHRFRFTSPADVTDDPSAALKC